MKPIRLSRHAREQCEERGATELEVLTAIAKGDREPTKRDRILCKYNFPFNATWQGHLYALKQVAPVIVEEDLEIVVITVYTFYF